MNGAPSHKSGQKSAVRRVKHAPGPGTNIQRHIAPPAIPCIHSIIIIMQNRLAEMTVMLGLQGWAPMVEGPDALSQMSGTIIIARSIHGEHPTVAGIDPNTDRIATPVQTTNNISTLVLNHPIKAIIALIPQPAQNLRERTPIERFRSATMLLHI